MGDADGDLQLGDADRRRLRDEVANLYPDLRAAARLLVEVGVERSRQPLWEGAGSPAGWWAEVFAAFDRGIAEAPYRRLLRCALAEHPANGVLREIARRHRVPAEPATAAAGLDPEQAVGTPRWDFFLSYTAADRAWAEWVAWELESAGYRVLLQAWDFVPGSNWMSRAREGIEGAERTLAIVSAAYLGSAYGQQEWDAAYRADPRGFTRKLVPVRVEDCNPPGLFGGVVYFDLFDCPTADGARRRLLDQIAMARAGRAKPPDGPAFPGPPAQPAAPAVPPHPSPHAAPPSAVPGAEPPFPGHGSPPPAGPRRPAPQGPAGRVDPDRVSRQVAAEADRVRGSQPGLSRRLALAAHRLSPNAEAGRSLLASCGMTPRAALAGHRDRLEGLAFSPDGRMVATASWDRVPRLWDVTDPARPTLLAALPEHAAPVTGVAFSPRGNVLATAGRDNRAFLWDVSERTSPGRIAVLSGHGGALGAVAFSPDGRLLATASNDGTARLWDADTSGPGAHVSTLAGHTSWLWGVTFSPDGTTMATTSADGTARLWDITTAREPRQLAVIDGHTGIVLGVAFSPGGQLLATTGYDNTTRLWDVTHRAEPRPLALLTGHTNVVVCVAFDPRGRFLATTSDDGTARLTDVTEPGEPRFLTAASGHGASVRAAAFSPAGTTLVSTGYDMRVRLWDLDLDRIAARACSEPNNRISRGEWDDHIPALPFTPPCGETP